MYLMEGKKLLDANVFDGRQKIAQPIVKFSHHDFVISRLLIPATTSIWVCVSHTFYRGIEDLLNLMKLYEVTQFHTI